MFTIAGATAYCNANAEARERRRRSTLRFRPEVMEGGVVDGLSFPRQDSQSEPQAEQKQNVREVRRQ